MNLHTKDAKGIDGEKRDFLKGLGIPDEDINQLEGYMTGFAGQALGRESKEGDDPDPEDTDTPDTLDEEEDPVEEPATASNKEVADAIVEVVSPILKELKALRADVNSLKNRPAIKEGTPPTSLKDLISAQMLDQKSTDEGPTETKKKADAQETGIPFLDALVSTSRNGS